MSKEKEFSLEDSLQHIREILDKMQRGVSDFDKQMALFKEGNQLIKDSRTYLDGAEMTIKQLVDGELKDLKSD